MSKSRFQKLASAGLCGECGVPREQSHKTLCNACLDSAKTRAHKTIDQRRAAGLCVRCGKNPPGHKKQSCEECLSSVRQAHKDKAALRRSETACSRCGEKLPNLDFAKCASCREAKRAQTLKTKLKVLAAYGRVCQCCGDDFPGRLTIDHINGGGTKHRQLVGGGARFYQKLLKDGCPPGYQVLCASCNLCKHINKGHCPH